jgi:hypothetical protein
MCSTDCLSRFVARKGWRMPSLTSLRPLVERAEKVNLFPLFRSVRSQGKKRFFSCSRRLRRALRGACPAHNTCAPGTAFRERISLNIPDAVPLIGILVEGTVRSLFNTM